MINVVSIDKKYYQIKIFKSKEISEIINIQN